MADPIDDIKEALDAKFTEFKKANDKTDEATKAELVKLTDQTDKLNESLTELDKLKNQIHDLETKAARNGFSGMDDADPEAEQYKSDFIDGFLRKGLEGPLIEKATTTGVPADGGYGVPEIVDKNIIQLERDQSPMRQVCNVTSMSSPDYKRLVNLGGASSGWVGETDVRPETSTPTMTQIVATMGEIYANPAASQTSLDDVYFNVENWIAGEVAREFAEKEGSAFLLGDGTNKPKGLLAGLMDLAPDATRAFGTIQQIKSGVAGDFDADTLISLIYACKAAYRRNGRFMMSLATVEKLRKFKDGQGNYLWQPSYQAGEPSRVIGFGIVENEDMPAVAAGANAIVFGDFKRAYTIIDRIGTRILRDPYTHKPFVHFYTTKRVGGLLVESSAVKVLNLAA